VVVEAEGRADGGSGQGQRGQSRCQEKELTMRKRPALELATRKRLWRKKTVEGAHEEDEAQGHALALSHNRSHVRRPHRYILFHIGVQIIILLFHIGVQTIILEHLHPSCMARPGYITSSSPPPLLELCCLIRIGIVFPTT
jgi:hypothetical protein